MNGNDILRGLGFIDEKLIYEAEHKKLNIKMKIIKFIVPIAASAAIFILSFTLYQNARWTLPQKHISDHAFSDSQKTITEYQLSFNQVSNVLAANIDFSGHFWCDIESEQLNEILPKVASEYTVAGTVHYSSTDGAADLVKVSALVTIDGKTDGRITIAPDRMDKEWIIDGEPDLSEIEGIPIEAGLFITDKNSKGRKNFIYYADFNIDGVAYFMECVSQNQEAEDVFTNLVADVILGGKADLSIFDNPPIPNIVEKRLTESEAYSEIDYGKYLFEIPDGYSFNSADRLLNQSSDFLFASWSKGYDDVTIRVSKLDEYSKARIVSPEETELYDMSLYPVPWADSMPRDQRDIIENPVFKAEDLSLGVIEQRGYTRHETGDPSASSLNMRFSVLYGDIIVEVQSEGLSAEYLYDKLTASVVE